MFESAKIANFTIIQSDAAVSAKITKRRKKVKTLQIGGMAIPTKDKKGEDDTERAILSFYTPIIKG